MLDTLEHVFAGLGLVGALGAAWWYASKFFVAHREIASVDKEVRSILRESIDAHKELRSLEAAKAQTQIDEMKARFEKATVEATAQADKSDASQGRPLDEALTIFRIFLFLQLTSGMARRVTGDADDLVETSGAIFLKACDDFVAEKALEAPNALPGIQRVMALKDEPTDAGDRVLWRIWKLTFAGAMLRLYLEVTHTFVPTAIEELRKNPKISAAELFNAVSDSGRAAAEVPKLFAGLKQPKTQA